MLYRALKRLYNLGIFPAWWKIEAQTCDEWKQLDELIQARDPYCRGVVLLGLTLWFRRASDVGYNRVRDRIDAFVAAHLWDVPAQLSVRAAPGRTTVAARLQW